MRPALSKWYAVRSVAGSNRSERFLATVSVRKATEVNIGCRRTVFAAEAKERVANRAMAVWEYEYDARGRKISFWNEGKYRYVTNLFHSVVRDAYNKRCESLGLRSWESLPPAERVALDWELIRQYGLDERTPVEVRYDLTQWLYAQLALG